MIIVNAHIEHYGENMFMAWAEGDAFKGVVVQADSVDNVKKELWTSLKVLVAHRLNLNISSLKGKEITNTEDLRIIEESDNEFKLQLV